MSSQKSKKHSFESLLIDNLKQNTEIKHKALLRTLNAGVISLFWDIGMLINTCLKQDNYAGNGNKLIKDIASHLSPLFGTYLTVKNLSLMKLFAENCPATTMTQISPFTNWEYIPICLNLKDDEAWNFYIQLTHTESLSPEELKRKISDKSFENRNKNAKTEQAWQILLLLSQSNFLHQSMLNLYFGTKTRSMFRKLFEPKVELHLKYYDKLLASKTANHEIISQIYSRILEFQSAYNHAMNILFNTFCWEIGNEIRRLSIIFDTPVNDKLLDYCIAELSENSPSIFNRAHLLRCLKFAEQYTERDQLTELTQTVSWPYIKILIDIDTTVETQLSIANQILSSGTSIPIKIERNRKSTLVTKEVLEPNINPNNDLNRNIFKNLDLLKFLKEVKGF